MIIKYLFVLHARTNAGCRRWLPKTVADGSEEARIWPKFQLAFWWTATLHGKLANLQLISASMHSIMVSLIQIANFWSGTSAIAPLYAYVFFAARHRKGYKVNCLAYFILAIYLMKNAYTAGFVIFIVSVVS